MSEKKQSQDPREIEIKKLKDILRNQILEIKKLKNELSLSANNSVSNESIDKLKSRLEQKYTAKHQSILEKKDDIIKDLKRDLKSSTREIEDHLRRHNDQILELHNKLISERASRDYLLNSITTELVNALKPTGIEKSKILKKTPRYKSEKEEQKIINVDRILVPESKAPTYNSKLNVLYAAPQTPNFDQSSGGKRAYLMLELLAQNHNVVCYTKGLAKELHKQALETIGVKVINKLEDHHINERVNENFDVIIIAWYYVYDEIKEILKQNPSAKVIVDTVDIHWVREERSLGSWESLTQEKFEENKEKEIDVYKKADIIWTVSEEDKKAVRKEIPDADVRIVSNIHILKDHDFVSDKPNNILFFGGYNHYPNLNAVELLAKKILPKIREQVPDATLTIAGSNAPEKIQQLGNLEGVNFRGFIEFEEISQLYNEAKLTIVPLTAGAGIKGKICEAIEYKVPVITNDIGNEGINLETGIDGFISNNYDEMALMAVDILNNKYSLNEITFNAQEKVKSLLGPEANLLVMEESFQPTVDICIVTYNKLELIKNCVDSIHKFTNYPNYNILIYSNGCSDGTQDYLSKLEEENQNIVAILSDTNDVFVKPNNIMMKTNSTHDVVLLNNDVVVTDNWLTALVNEAYKSRKIGIVGSKILYPDNTLQEFGSELYITGSGLNIGKGDNPNDSKYMFPRKASYVSGCSMYIKRKTITSIGVFDELFDPCYAEDSDYCYRAWAKDIEVNVSPSSIIYHLEGASSGTDTSKGFKKFQKINIQKFLERHGRSLAKINARVKSLNTEYPFLN